MVLEHAESHERRRASADLRVEQEHVRRRGALLALRQASGQLEVVQHRLATLDLGLNQHAADRHVAQDAAQALLERRAGAQDADATQRDVEPRADVRELRSRRDFVWSVGKKGERLFDNEGRQPVREEDEVGEEGGAVAEKCVDALLARGSAFLPRGGF